MHHCFIHKDRRAVSSAGIAITGSGRPHPGHVTQCLPGPELTAPIISCTGVAGLASSSDMDTRHQTTSGRQHNREPVSEVLTVLVQSKQAFSLYFIKKVNSELV